MDKRKYFLKVFSAAVKKYGKLEKRLAAEDWPQSWQVLISTIMSAQSRDETTIPIAEQLFHRYPSLKALANARYVDVLRIFKSLNYNKTKAPEQTEQELMKIAPRKYWAPLNRIFVLWGKDVPGRDKKKLLKAIGL